MLAPEAAFLKLRLELLAPRTLHLYVLIADPSSAREPAASSGTSAPSGEVDGKACRSCGELMSAVGCDSCPIQSTVSGLVVALLAAPMSWVGLLLRRDLPRVVALLVLMPGCCCASASAADSLAWPAREAPGLRLRLVGLAVLVRLGCPAATCSVAAAASVCRRMPAASAASSCRAAAIMPAAATVPDRWTWGALLLQSATSAGPQWKRC